MPSYDATTIDVLYFEEPTGAICHYTAIWNGSIVRWTDFDGSLWLSNGRDIIKHADNCVDPNESPASAPPVHQPVTQALHGRIHNDVAGGLSYRVAAAS